MNYSSGKLNHNCYYCKIERVYYPINDPKSDNLYQYVYCHCTGYTWQHYNSLVYYSQSGSEQVDYLEFLFLITKHRTDEVKKILINREKKELCTIIIETSLSATSIDIRI